MPSRRLEAVLCPSATLSSVLHGHGACWIDFGILECLLRGCVGWYKEASVEGVERIQLPDEFERHGSAYAISSCSRLPGARQTGSWACCGGGGAGASAVVVEGRSAASTFGVRVLRQLPFHTRTRPTPTPPPTPSGNYSYASAYHYISRQSISRSSAPVTIARDEHSQLVDRTRGGRVCRR